MNQIPLSLRLKIVVVELFNVSQLAVLSVLEFALFWAVPRHVGGGKGLVRGGLGVG